MQFESLMRGAMPDAAPEPTKETPNMKKKWSAMPCFDQLGPGPCDLVKAAFPGGPRELADLMTAGKRAQIIIDFYANDLSVSLEHGGCDNCSKTPFENLNRRFDFREGILRLNGLSIKEDKQRKGLGRKILQGQRMAALRLGMRKMEIHATGTGSYVWARAGFLPDFDDWRALAESLDRQLDMEFPQLGARKKAAVRDVFNNRPPEWIWRVADLDIRHRGRRIGKALLTNVSWSGEFDLLSARQGKRLKKYVKGKV